MKPAICGATKLYGIIADPIEHVRATALFNAYFEQHSLDAVFVPFHVHPEGAAAALGGFRRMVNLHGVIVTIPHKTAFVHLVDEVLPTARLASATNVIRPEPDGRWIGTNLDGMGFVNGLTDQIFPPMGRSFLVVGCGGAGSAIAATLIQSGITRLAIAELQRERAERLSARLSAAMPDVPVSVFGANPDPAGYDVVVNATPLGMREDDPLPFDLARLSSGTVVAEVVQAPPVTRLLREAAARGLRTLQGGNMLDYQFIEMARFFRIVQ
jgi:shikimate dehydrogenase